jgi:hypothetical protein
MLSLSMAKDVGPFAACEEASAYINNISEYLKYG